MSHIQDYAKLLDDAAHFAHEVEQFDTDNRLSLDDAYAIQAASLARRAERGPSPGTLARSWIRRSISGPAIRLDMRPV